MFKGGLTYTNMITTVSETYAGEIQTPFYGENLDAHLRYHSGKLRGIVNGIDYGMWNTAEDALLAAPYDITNVLEKKKANKLALQEELGLEKDEGKFVIGLISRLTNQKGLDLVNAIIPELIDGNTQIVVLGTGDAMYEDSFRYYENAYKGSVCSNIMYDEGRAHKIYAGADALLVPSQFEPCGLTQLIAMHYGTVPIVRETGGLKDTVDPVHQLWKRIHLRQIRRRTPAGCHQQSQDTLLYQPLVLGRDGAARHGQGCILGEFRKTLPPALSGTDSVTV